MNTLFPYNPPDPQKVRSLKKRLLKEHQQLYGQQSPFWKRWFFAPSLLMLIMLCSFSSFVAVEAFSPEAQFYGALYGTPARISFATSKVLSAIHAGNTPILPGLTKEETASFGKQSGSGQLYLQSKVARALPKELQKKITISESLPPAHLPALRTSLDTQGVVTLTWDEVLLASGALPAGYVVFSSTDELTWKKLTTTTTTTYTEAITTSTWYRVSIIDWQEQLLLQSMEAHIDLPTTQTPPTRPIELPAIEHTPQKPTPPPTYDHADEELPKTTVALTMNVRQTGTSISLSWNTIPLAEGYNIYRDALKYNTAPLTTTSFIDSSVLPGKTYQYQIRAVDSSGNEVTASEKLSERIPLIPKGPSNLQASLNGATVTLTWNDVAVSDKEGYALVRTTVDSGKKIHTTTKTSTFVDNNTLSGEQYTYAVYTLMKDSTRSKEYATISISIP